MKQKVVIVGAGIAGLTAAQELIERGFDVHVYERRRFAGGKAASTRSATNLPGEHGFRFFPGWYRHLPDTMKRIPFQGKRRYYEGNSVYDNLTEVDTNRLGWSNLPFVDVRMHRPASLGEARDAADLLGRLRGLGLTPGELSFFLGRLVQYRLSSALTRRESFGTLTWWDYLEAGSKSQAFQGLVHATTRLTISAKATQVSADTLAKLAIRTLDGWLREKDRVLNGPTSEVFIDWWQEALVQRGVHFHFDHELSSIKVSGEKKAIESLTFTSAVGDSARRLRRLLPLLVKDAAAKGRSAKPTENQRFAEQLVEYLKPHLRLSDVHELLGRRSDTIEEDLRVIERQGRKEVAQEVKASYFVFSLPLEQMAYYVNRAGTLREYDPGLERILALVDYTDWMSGIQFYLRESFQSVRGHLIAIDSPWSITALEQTQFWQDVDRLPSDVKAVISVDIAAWDKPGRFLRKEAFNCSDEEIAHEVWEELKLLVARGDQPRLLRDDMLRGGALAKGFSFHVDESLVDLADRKKQGAYEHGRSIILSRESRDRAVEADAVLPHVWGPRLRFNAEPLLINCVGTAELRPEARTGIQNMFLAADYVQTETDLACMEGANEAARRAVNALLDADNSDATRCELFSFAESTLSADRLTALLPLGEAPALALDAARATARELFGAATRAFGQFLGNGDKRK
jgi:uncharacterized protein with NAD-binding domain and iron-sulfur cluster